jgi:hypothetical protein
MNEELERKVFLVYYVHDHLPGRNEKIHEKQKAG